MDIPIQRKINIVRQHIRNWEDQVTSDQITVETAELIEDNNMRETAVANISKGLKALKGLREKLAKLEKELADELAEAEEL